MYTLRCGGETQSIPAGLPSRRVLGVAHFPTSSEAEEKKQLDGGVSSESL